MSEGPDRPAPRLRRCFVLDEDPGLATGLPATILAGARRVATARLVLVPVGDQPLQSWYGNTLRGPGLLIIRGVIAREMHVAGRCATELLGAGDLVRPWDMDAEELVPFGVVWRVLRQAELAVLDADFADRISRWPSIAEELMGRAEHRAESLAVQRAIASHPRVDMRVAMLLWHLASRWGHAGPDGTVTVDLPLTHRLIGELVAAERPSVSHALARLTRSGLLACSDRGWILSGTPSGHVTAAQRPLKQTGPLAAFE